MLGDLWQSGSGIGTGWTACPGNESLGEELSSFRGWIYSIQCWAICVSALSPLFYSFFGFFLGQVMSRKE